MDETISDLLIWLLKIAGVLIALWFITGGPARIEQKRLNENFAPAYQPKVYTQTIILK